MNGRRSNLIVKCGNCKGYRYALHDTCHRCSYSFKLVVAQKAKKESGFKLERRIVKPIVPTLTDSNAAFVYLISDGNFSKIGYAKNLAVRLSTLQNATPYELRLIDAVETTEYRALEAFLHGLFARKHHRNEWFTHIMLQEWQAAVARAQSLLAEQYQLRLVASA